MTNAAHLDAVSLRYNECIQKHGNQIENIEKYFDINILAIYGVTLDDHHKVNI